MIMLFKQSLFYFFRSSPSYCILCTLLYSNLLTGVIKLMWPIMCGFQDLLLVKVCCIERQLILVFSFSKCNNFKYMCFKSLFKSIPDIWQLNLFMCYVSLLLFNNFAVFYSPIHIKVTLNVISKHPYDFDGILGTNSWTKGTLVVHYMYSRHISTLWFLNLPE